MPGISGLSGEDDDTIILADSKLAPVPPENIYMMVPVSPFLFLYVFQYLCMF